MSLPAIEIQNISKRYRIGAQKDPYLSLREELSRRLSSAGRRRRAAEQEFWALRDVNFAVERGETVGIIGRNGAGKSTLLKILSQITPPTEGKITMRGRVGSLLEVGTGFHPELTGRENVYMNGAILGMGRREITGKFDEIVAFAEMEQFLDTPVKRYSSGMYVRLAFSVAAHLEPEILVVDEVLAVGDVAFQKKCLSKMGEAGQRGRTVLFVSHNMSAIQALCESGVLLDRGRVVERGTVSTVVEGYMRSLSTSAAVPLADRPDRKGDGRVRLSAIAIDGGTEGLPIRCGDSLRIRIDYSAERAFTAAAFLVGIYDQYGRPIFFLDTRTVGWAPASLPAVGRVTCHTSPINLTAGPCTVNVAVMLGGEVADHLKQACSLDIEADDFYGTGKLPDRQKALCLLRQDWTVEAAGPGRPMDETNVAL